MPVFPKGPEFDRLKVAFDLAVKDESRTIAAAMAVGDIPGPSAEKTAALRKATTDMEAAHNHKMDIWEQMLELRLDK